MSDGSRLIALVLVLSWLQAPPANAHQTTVAGGSLVIDGATVVDVEHGRLLPAQRIVISGNRILAAGDRRTVTVPKGARMIEARGKYLIPGLWDMHTHPHLLRHLFDPLYIANGVTGIRDAWSRLSLDTLVIQWQEILAGARIGPPRQLLAGGFPEGDGRSRQGAELDAYIAARKALGANFYKLYPFTFQAAASARRVGIPFGGHLSKLRGASIFEASDSGAKILDHVHVAGLDTLCLGPAASEARCQPVADRFRQNGTWWVPTLTVDEQIDPEYPHVGLTSRAILQHLHEFGQRFWIGTPLRYSPRVLPSTPSVNARGLLSIAQRVGLPMLAGADGTARTIHQLPPGFSLHTELAMLVTEGLTPLEALRSATLNPAKLINGTDSLGTVAAGKLADLVLLDADPLIDIANTTAIRAVVANGRYFDRAALDRLVASVQDPRFWLRRQHVPVLPLSIIAVDQGLQNDPRYAPYRTPAIAGAWLDSVIGAALIEQRPDVSWGLPAEIRQRLVGRRATQNTYDYAGTLVDGLLNVPLHRVLPDSLRDALRRVKKTGDHDWLLLAPAALQLAPAQKGRGIRVELSLILVNNNRGMGPARVIWRADVSGEGDTPAAALAAAFAAALAPR